MPWYHHYGLVSIPDAILKTSTVGKGIKTGEYTGWDDVRLGTVGPWPRGASRPEAIRAFWIDCGIKEVDIEFSWDSLYAYNRDLIEKVPTAVRSLGPATVGHLRRGPPGVQRAVASGSSGEGRSASHWRASPSWSTWSRPTWSRPSERGKVRLKDLCNLEIVHGKGKYIGNDLAILKEKVRIINWVPDNSRPCEVLMPDGIEEGGLRRSHCPIQRSVKSSSSSGSASCASRRSARRWWRTSPTIDRGIPFLPIDANFEDEGEGPFLTRTERGPKQGQCEIGQDQGAYHVDRLEQAGGHVSSGHRRSARNSEAPDDASDEISEEKTTKSVSCGSGTMTAMAEPPMPIQNATWNGFPNEINAPVTKSDRPARTYRVWHAGFLASMNPCRLE